MLQWFTGVLNLHLHPARIKYPITCQEGNFQEHCPFFVGKPWYGKWIQRDLQFDSEIHPQQLLREPGSKVSKCVKATDI